MVAGWLWREWWHQDGYTLEQTHDAIAASVSLSGPPQSFVLLVDGKPIGTASLVAHDLDERPDLTPWLAGVFAIPEARGRGHVVHLIQAVEAACPSAAIPVVWLYTAGAEPTLEEVSVLRPYSAARRAQFSSRVSGRMNSVIFCP